MTDTDCRKALTLLIHDLRAPLSVAQGYLRLLKDDRLESAESRARALEQTMAALGRIARLCADGASFAEEAPAPPPGARTIETRRLLDEVAERVAAREGPVLVLDLPDRGALGEVRGPHADRLADSIVTVLGAAHRASADAPVHVDTTAGGREVRFMLGGADARARLLHAADPFDAWRGGHGLALPLACRTIEAAGGRIWSALDARGAVAIALPQERS
ncbi:MAG: hypothetical protein AB7O32_06660 [Vicinamibacterales bacterium]